MHLKSFCFFLICFMSLISSRTLLCDILKKTLTCKHDRTLNLEVNKMNVYFYDFPETISHKHSVNEAAHNILSYKKLDKKKKFIVFVGGFTSDINKNSEIMIRNALRNQSNSYLIILNHSDYTHNEDFITTSYKRSVKHVYYIGKQLAQMLADLHKGGIPAENIHCIGHSLGSHILGHAGEHFIKATKQNISRITALDPAGPCFEGALIQNHIKAGVAKYVEVYHCDDGALGTSSVLGDVDFYVNKGYMQPSCKVPMTPKFLDCAIAAKCNHKFCVEVWISTVIKTNSYTAYKCKNFKEFKEGKCSKNENTSAGFWNPGKATGVYYFSTDSKHN